MEEAAEVSDVVLNQFGVVDYVLFSLMLVGSVGIGLWSAYRSRGKETTEDYLLGSETMSPFPVGLSLLGGIISAISILGNPTEVYLYGTQLCISIIGIFFGCLVVYHVTYPILYGLKLVSINQYLRLRFKSRAVQILGTICQLIVKFFYMGICLYAPSLALSTVTSLSTWGSMLLMGLVCTFYISVGGVKAVVYTDVMQTILMFTGVLLVICIVCRDMGGVANVWDVADQGKRIEFFNFNTSPYERHTFWSTLVFGIYFTINVVGINQSGYQRLASVGSITKGKGLIVFFYVGMIALWGLFFFSGVVAYAAYSTCDPLTSGRIEKADQVIPYLVMEKLGHLPGLPGIFVAAVYGGVLSSLSSTGNSLACLIWEDLLKNIPFFKRMSPLASTTVLKLLSMLAGLSGIGIGVAAGKMGNIFNAINSFSGSVMGPMQGVFLTGMFTPWVNWKGALSGFTVAFAYNMFVVFGKFGTGRGKPVALPLSVEGCPENQLLHHIANSTLHAFTDPHNATSTFDTFLPTTTTTTAAMTTDSLVHNSTDWLTTQTLADDSMVAESKSIFDISYCFFGITGILITIIISNIVSFFTGPLNPWDTEDSYATKLSVRLHRWFWRTFRGSDKCPGLPGSDTMTVTAIFPAKDTQIVT